MINGLEKEVKPLMEEEKEESIRNRKGNFLGLEKCKSSNGDKEGYPLFERDVSQKRERGVPEIRVTTLLDTRIDYPVVESIEERDYCLHRDYYGKESYSGTPFICSGSLKDENGTVFLYGHHMRNGTMFADLMKYQEKSFWEKHPAILLDTLYEHHQYQIFAAFYAKESDWTLEDGLLFTAVNFGESLEAKDIELITDAGIYDTGIP